MVAGTETIVVQVTGRKEKHVIAKPVHDGRETLPQSLGQLKERNQIFLRPRGFAREDLAAGAMVLKQIRPGLEREHAASACRRWRFHGLRAARELKDTGEVLPHA